MDSIFNIAPFLKTGVVFRLERNDILTLTNIYSGNYVQVLIKENGTRFGFKFGNEDEDRRMSPLEAWPRSETWFEEQRAGVSDRLISGATLHLGKPPEN